MSCASLVTWDGMNVSLQVALHETEAERAAIKSRKPRRKAIQDQDDAHSYRVRQVSPTDRRVSCGSVSETDVRKGKTAPSDTHARSPAHIHNNNNNNNNNNKRTHACTDIRTHARTHAHTHTHTHTHTQTCSSHDATKLHRKL